MFVPIRPERYTHSFVEKHGTASLSFFEDSYKETLLYLGTVSGRDENKIEKSGLTVDYIDNTPVYKQAKLTLIGKKLSHLSLDQAGFVDMEIYNKLYSDQGEHHIYI